MEKNRQRSSKKIISSTIARIAIASAALALPAIQPNAALSEPHDDGDSASLSQDANFKDPTLSRDTDFGKHSYSDSLDLKRRLEKRDNTFKVEKGVLAGDPKFGIRPFPSDGVLIDGRLDEELFEVRKPILEVSGDWVPDKLDPANNGGFEVSPDNGSPVPYRLNGHVDIQRGRPWDINN